MPATFTRMWFRSIAVMGVLSALQASTQAVLDAAYISERWLLNTTAHILEYEGVETPMLYHSERLRHYALEEPHHWTDRRYFRIDPSANKAFASLRDTLGTPVSIADILNAANLSGSIWEFADPHFREYVPEGSRSTLAPGPILLKVDFLMEEDGRSLRAFIVGFSLRRSDGGWACFYYPELRYLFRHYVLTWREETISLTDLFDQWRFISAPVNTVEVPTAPPALRTTPPLEEQAEFEALVALFLVEREADARGVIRSGKRKVLITSYAKDPAEAHLHFLDDGRLSRMELRTAGKRRLSVGFREGKPHGPFREFGAGGRLRQEGVFDHGLRTGTWTSWHPTGNIRSRRIYSDGVLHGRQRVYHANGKPYLEYDMVRGDYHGEHRTWYPDGGLCMAGPMEEGFVSGTWTYHLRIDDTLKAFLDVNPWQVSFPPAAWEDGVLSYTVTYRIDPEMAHCLLNRCLVSTHGAVE